MFIRSGGSAVKNEDRSRNERLELYSEIGQYFKPDGSFDEEMFSSIIQSGIDKIKKGSGNEEDFVRDVGQWLSEYLDQVLTYLIEKDMFSAALQLFRTALAETSKTGLKNLYLPQEFLIRIATLNEEMTEAKSLTRPAKDQKRQKIFSAALKVFEQAGFRRATMDAIAAAAEMGKASVYRVFKNKEVLLDELLSEQYREIVTSINDIHSGQDDVLQQVRDMVQYWVSYIAEHPVIYQLIQTESNPAGVNNRVIFFDFLTSGLPMFKERIVARNRENRLKTINFYSVFYGMMGYIDGVVIKWLRDEKQYDLRDEIPEILEVLFKGFMVH